MDDSGGSGLDAAVIAVDCCVLADRGVGKVPGLLLGGKDLDILPQRGLIAFQRQDVIGLLVDNFLCDLTLAADGVDRDDRPLDRQPVEKLRDRDDLIGLFRHLDLAEDETLACGKGRNQVDRSLAAARVAGPAHGLAINRNDALRQSGQGGHPRNKAALELLSIESGQKVAEVIVGRWAVPERTEAPKEIKLLAATQGHLGEELRATMPSAQAP